MTLKESGCGDAGDAMNGEGTRDEVKFIPEENGSTRAELSVDGEAISRLWIVPFHLRIGDAVVRMDGIAGVGTDEAHRNRGYSRLVLEATVAWMKQGDAAISMLYGIPDYYPKFGYATAGPDYFTRCFVSEDATPLPHGWTAEPCVEADLPDLKRLYEESVRHAVGAAVRPESGGVWASLPPSEPSEEDEPTDQCEVVRDASRRARAYLWQGSRFWYIRTNLKSRYADALVIGEAVADSLEAAEALYAVCERWAREEAVQRGEAVKSVVVCGAPEGPMAGAARFRWATLEQRFAPAAESMALVLNLRRLMESLLPELNARWRTAGLAFTGDFRLETMEEAVTLRITPEAITLASEGDATRSAAATLTLSQETMARLIFGAFRPEDLLALLPAPPSAVVTDLVCALFPERHPYMNIPDRF